MLERVQFGEALLLLVLAGGFVALVELRLRILLSVGVWSLCRRRRFGCYVVDCVWGLGGLFRGRQWRCVYRADCLEAAAVVSRLLGRSGSGSRGQNFDAHAVSAGRRRGRCVARLTGYGRSGRSSFRSCRRNILKLERRCRGRRSAVRWRGRGGIRGRGTDV